ncbi:MAG: hypothetical protein J6B68_06510 [Lachnospiraceae bacterium]|jgi:hypothetical protein|nr:hypothetical protein [Peptococcaceae bacterium]MBO5208981.1 hypothetical protein [Lachnospiraceae bacterium]
MNGFESDSICKTCGGNCCKTMGCSLSPEDMHVALEGKEATTEVIEALLQDSMFAIDSFQMRDGAFYYLRMRHKCFTFIGVDAMGECIALTEIGCSLPFDKRPKGGRFLEGKEGHQCTQHYTQEMMVKDWEPYQNSLREIWNKWHNQMQQDGTFDKCEEDYMQYQRTRARNIR